MSSHWRKIILFSFIVILPAVAVGISNYYVFHGSFLMATILLAVTVGVAGLFTYYSGDSTPRIRRYCILADIAICVILCVNLGSHWALSREVSAAQDSVTERHMEEDRQEARTRAAAEREIALKSADANLLQAQRGIVEAERRRLNALPVEMRRSQLPVQIGSGISASPTPLIPSLPTPAVVGHNAEKAAALTPEQVRESWYWFLTILAYIECFASVLAGAILAGVWEWDRDHDGVADHLQTGQGSNRSFSWPDEIDEPVRRGKN